MPKNEAQIRAELDRLTQLLRKPRMPQYRRVAITVRATTLEWALGDSEGFGDEAADDIPRKSK